MNNPRINISIFFYLFLISIPCYGLNLNDSIQKSIQKDISIEIARGKIKIEEAEVLGNIFDMFPKISAATSYDFTDNPPKLSVPIGPLNAFIDNPTINLTGRNTTKQRVDATIPIFYWGEQLAVLNYSKSKKNLELIKLKNKELEVRQSVVKLYSSLNLCERSLNTLSSAVEFYKLYYEKIQILFQHSSAILLDVKQAHAKFLSAKSELSTEKAQCHQLERQFETTVGEPIGKIQPLPAPILKNINQEDWLKQSIKNNPMIQIYVHQEEMSEHLFNQSKAQILPKFDLNAFYLAQQSDLTPNVNTWGVSVTARIPIFDWHHTITPIQKASIERDNHQSELIKNKTLIENEIKTTIELIQSTQELAESIEAELSYSKEKLKNFSEKKHLSAETDLHLLEQKISQLKLKLKLDQAWNEYSIQLSNLYALAGENPELAFKSK